MDAVVPVRPRWAMRNFHHDIDSCRGLAAPASLEPQSLRLPQGHMQVEELGAHPRRALFDVNIKQVRNQNPETRKEDGPSHPV